MEREQDENAGLPALERRSLGKSGIDVPLMGFGSAPVAGLYKQVDEDAALETMRFAYEQGITLFDTAPLYSLGWAETLIGHALVGIPRDRYVISTKVGRVIQDGKAVVDFSRDGILRSLDASLARLQTDRVEILHIHDPDHHIDLALAEGFPVLEELRRQGVIRAVGAGMNQWQALAQFAMESDFDCFLLAGRYTLLEQTSLDFLELCRSKRIGILLGGVYNTGILATGAVPGAKYQYRDAPPEIMERTRALETLGAQHGVALSAAALQFAAAHPAVSSLVIGAAAKSEIAANLAALAAPIPAAYWQDLRAGHLVEDAAPLPGVATQ